MSGQDAFGSGHGPVAGSCEHGDEPSDSIQGGEFLDQLRRTCFMELVQVMDFWISVPCSDVAEVLSTVTRPGIIQSDLTHLTC
jgi:hypothetical protein